MTEYCRFAENKDGQIVGVLCSGRFFDKDLSCQKKACEEKDCGQAGGLPSLYWFFVLHVYIKGWKIRTYRYARFSARLSHEESATRAPFISVMIRLSNRL